MGTRLSFELKLDRHTDIVEPDAAIWIDPKHTPTLEDDVRVTLNRNGLVWTGRHELPEGAQGDIPFTVKLRATPGATWSFVVKSDAAPNLELINDSGPVTQPWYRFWGVISV